MVYLPCGDVFDGFFDFIFLIKRSVEVQARWMSVEFEEDGVDRALGW